ncbi:MAG: DUF3300 domain-containing protein [Woeseiaceae bacterium]
MKNRLNAKFGLAKTLLTSFAWLALLPAAALAQVPVDESGEIIGDFEKQYSEPATGNDDIPLLSTAELEELVGPIALYPDDLLAIVLPAAAYPLQIVDAARFLEALENDSSLEPDPDWDDSVVALLNYPEVVELLNDDIDWTWRLGEAVVSQQSDVVGAIETFRDRAYTAGNLKSDSYQNVTRDEGTIEITPVAEDVIYVPYYEPARVVVYQPRPVYYYYPRPYPVYYYPYSSSYIFDRGYFWGVTTAFTIGWYSDSLNVFHHSYFGHPYYGRSYWDRWWYRRPTRTIYNTTYVSNHTNVTVNRYYGGDRWRPREDRRNYVSTRSVTRNRLYPSPRPDSTRSRATRIDNEQPNVRSNTRRRDDAREPISFRERPRNTRVAPRSTTASRARTVNAPAVRQSQTRDRSREPQDGTTYTRDRRSEPTPKLRSAEPSVPARRREAAPQTRRSPAAQETRRAEPQRQVREAAPQRQVRQAEPRREETVQKRSSGARKARQSSEQKSERSSEQKSERSSKRQPSPRTRERRR